MASTSTSSCVPAANATDRKFIYGTAWKKDKTKELVKEAVANGFRAIDTAAQPRHYQEPLVGEALQELYRSGLVKRQDIYLQTKYTTPAGQDLNNMPYHPLDPLETQIHTSVSSSLMNLRSSEDPDEISYVDGLLLHSPLPTLEQTLQAWDILEAYVPDKIRSLGISNVTLSVLQAIYENSTVKPSVVQNRFYADTNYDVGLRAFCREHNITYQSFWTLTGNPKLLKSQSVTNLARSVNVSQEIALYALVISLEIVPLNGTTSSEHMRTDLVGIQKIEEWKAKNELQWESECAAFAKLIEL
ncbi:aldo-keto reductase-like protein [Amniculicola lignicola CBS 123094]|uniref:Aldo-keto reductase-like protein n=1 Tax=Amniculicola lignicola CBS 123094 TaxID=1392246 RepID=A0A6A5W982_9PLEO|nr:aldo-keto reductase-like protein [Amniculicola lignicola CBS 123094]